MSRTNQGYKNNKDRKVYKQNIIYHKRNPTARCCVIKHPHMLLLVKKKLKVYVNYFFL